MRYLLVGPVASVIPGLAIVSLPSGFISDVASDKDSAVYTQVGVCFVVSACSSWLRDILSSMYMSKSQVHRISSQ